MTTTAAGGNARTVIWFSCGAASAVAAPLVLSILCSAVVGDLAVAA
jgi:hypothetical protein